MPTPTDSQYVTGDIPVEMREGIETDELALLGVKVAHQATNEGGLTRVSIGRPAHIPPANPAAMPPGFQYAPVPVHPGGQVLTYDFPLLPGVQAHIALVGETTADHLEQLVDYLTVACKRLREQEGRNLMAERLNGKQRASEDAAADETEARQISANGKRAAKAKARAGIETMAGGEALNG